MLRSCVWLALCAALLAAPARADERILSFHSEITVTRDGTLEVRETIRVRAEGNHIRRGIYRDFPTTYPGAGGRTIVVGFAFQAAARDGVSEPWRIEKRGNGARIYLGSAAVMVPRGVHTYELVYRTDRQMGFFADHDELYWNVTGNGWDFPIDQATARVRLPEDVPPNEIRLEAYTGAQGARGGNYSAQLDGASPMFSTTRPLRPREGLTIVAMWPKGYVSAAVERPLPPSPIASPGYDYARDAGNASGKRRYESLAEGVLKRDLPRNNAPVYVAGFGFALLLIYYYFIWDRVGRDPPGRVIIPEYESPPGLSAAAMRYILRMRYDDACFGAGILSLAVKGYLHIQQDSGILGFGKKFTLVERPEMDGRTLPEDEKALLARLFMGGGVLELKQENHEIVSASRSGQLASLKRQYKSGFFRINGGWHAVGVVFSLLYGVLAFALPGDGSAPWVIWLFVTPLGGLTIAFLLGGLVANGVFGTLLKAPTVVGQAAMDKIRGFKMYLEVAEGEGIRRVSGPPPPKLTPELYESYLPAALALGVDQAWAEKFARVLDIEATHYAPSWYSGAAWNAANFTSFSSNLGASLNSAISSAATAPGSHSGGGGGGSSGGGGGGGGGGGW